MKKLKMKSILMGFGFLIIMYGLMTTKPSDEETFKKYLVQYSDLTDPYSAQVRLSKVNANQTRFCGQINGKNTFGAYVGWTHFFAEKYVDGTGKERFFLDLRKSVAGIPPYALASDVIRTFCG
ncbi:hypothetical protein [Stutzerimonas zhaodongensis]|uniref:hypothetical protein n=1 Tax=Stutzerimonas zhaodongensis TaxID=1176257 RepID=UPI0021054E86|nr:hypothetical protein [Stutzerimonas zhaodongensis]MCQ2032238.1 hypothetical protein [Stutzerimonas zhaodongensis]